MIGLNHIPTESLSPHMAICAITDVLANIPKDLQLEDSTHLALAKIIAHICCKMIKFVPRKWISIKTLLVDTQLLTNLHKLLDKFMIMGLKKASNNATIMCNQLAYILQDQLNTRNIKHNYPTLPVLFPIYKAHKHKFRWISNTSQCLFYEITTIISKALNLVLKYFHNICAQKQKDVKIFLGFVTNPFWINLSYFFIYMTDIWRVWVVKHFT